MVRISEKDRQWLETTFKNESYGKGLRGNVVYDYLYAEKVLKGYDRIKKRGCSCNYGSLKNGVDKLYKEFIDGKIQ
jgi:hypothetical protein